MNINVKDPKFLRWAGAVLLVLVVVALELSKLLSKTNVRRIYSVSKLYFAVV